MINETTGRPVVIGVFPDRDGAEHAYQTLQSKGYSKDDINIVMSDNTRKKHFGTDGRKTELGSKAMEGAGAGSAIGGTLGAIAGIIAGIGTSLFIPGLGIVIAGPLAAGLAGAGAGGATGGIIGALIGSGIPKEKAEVYERGIKGGNIVISVNAHSAEDADFFEREWSKSNVLEIHH
jgi:hypothetical protein